MTIKTWIIIFCCGLGTFLLRMLPMKWQLDNNLKTRNNSFHRFLMALGPTAITALLVTSIWPAIYSPNFIHSTIVLALSFSAITLAKRVLGGIIIPMSCGVIFYGLLQAVWLNP